MVLGWGWGRAASVVKSFHPASLPLLSRRSYALELTATFFFAMTLAAIEGGVISVFTKQTFAGIVKEGRLNALVAVLGATAELANILSFVWGSLAQGKAKVAFVNGLQVTVIVLVGAIAMLPQTPVGLYLLTIIVIAARSCWSGIITLRPTIWRANYPQESRAQIVGRFSTVQMLVVASVGMGLGYILDHTENGYRVAVPVLGLAGLAAVAAYGKLRVRHETGLLRRERDGGGAVMKPWMGPVVMWRVLHKDARYAQFMMAMFILGFGNLMVTPVLVITLRERFDLSYLPSILITSSIPALIMPLAIPAWARFLDRAHVVQFRSIHSWVFVLAGAVLLLGAVTRRVEFLYAGAVIQGVAFGGGTLAWNLGHVDFAPPSETSQYMATHVTLNGLRGLIAPLVAVALYESVKHAGGDAPVFCFSVSLGVSVVGAMGFVVLKRAMAGVTGRVSRRVDVPAVDKPRLK